MAEINKKAIKEDVKVDEQAGTAGNQVSQQELQQEKEYAQQAEDQYKRDQVDLATYLSLTGKYSTTLLGLSLLYVHATTGSSPNIPPFNQALDPDDLLLVERYGGRSLGAACTLMASGRF